MFCKNCGYRLWNLPSRTCPECGTPFKPSDFEFVLNSVEFRCPHCAQSYYGTGVRGHLVPSEFDCVRCRNHIHMDEMILLPTEGVEEQKTRVDPMPWLERSRLGLIRGWWGTVKMALLRPPRLMELTPEAGSTASAFWFAAFTNCVIYVVFMLPLLALELFMSGGVQGGRSALHAAGRTAMLAIVPLVLVLGGILVGGAVTHFLLRITGRTSCGLARTYQALGFASGANVLSALPCLGGYVGWIWPLISAVLMVRTGQRVSAGRAAFAVLTPPLTVIGGLICLMVWTFTYGFGLASSRASAAPYAMSGQAQIAASQPVLNAIKQYASAHNGRGPRHAADLLTGDAPLPIVDLVSQPDAVDLSTYPLAGTTLGDFENLLDSQRAEAVATAVANLPDNVVAHRLGDCVFTYHGIDFANPDGRLWVLLRVVRRPNGASGGSAGEYAAVRADGQTEWESRFSIAAALSMQNRIRAEHKLAPLPSLDSVTAEKPAGATFRPDATGSDDDDPQK